MLRLIQDPLILQVTERCGRNTSNQSQENSHLTRLSQKSPRILETFNWYFTSRLIAVIGQFEKHVGTDNPGKRWKQALLDFAYQNVGFNLKQLIRVLRYDLQVAIHEGLVKVQDDLLEAIANFTDNFHITITMLSAPQVHALLDHMHARHAGSHSFLAAVRCGMTVTRTESFLKNGPAKLLQSFFDRFPDHQMDIERGLTHLTDLEMEVNHFSSVLQTHLVDVTSNPTQMLNFNCAVEGVPTIDLTKDEIEVHYLPHKGNIAEDQEDDMEMPTAMPNPSTHQPATHAGSSKTPAPPADQQLFSPQPIGRQEALMSKENRTLTLMKVGTEQALTRFDAHASQDEASYDGDVSDTEDDIKVVPDKVDDTQVKSLKPVGAASATGKEV